MSVATQASEDGIVPLERLEVPEKLTGRDGLNRAPTMACALDTEDDLSAIRVWLAARASNPNTLASYRKEAERFCFGVCVNVARRSQAFARATQRFIYVGLKV